MSEELSEMQREWRASVTSSIRSSEQKLDLVLEQITTMRLECVKQPQLDLLTQRVAGLEADRAKVVGAAVVLNLIGGLIIFLITKFWK